MSDIIDEVNLEFQNGQTIFRGQKIGRLLARSFQLREVCEEALDYICKHGDGFSSQRELLKNKLRAVLEGEK